MSVVGRSIPIRYLHRTFSPSELIAHYRAADIALITPLPDGLNLVAKVEHIPPPEAARRWLRGFLSQAR